MDKRKVLLIGGTGTISSSIMRNLAADEQTELYVLNRGHKTLPEGVIQLTADIGDEQKVREVTNDLSFDVIADFIIFTKEAAEQRIRLFRGKTKQYIFISTVVTFRHEDTVYLDEESAQDNIYSDYGRSKTACEQVFKDAYDEGFPVTIVRPSQTYGYDRFPLSVKGRSCWSVVSRILRDKPVIVHGDGKSVWHMMHTYDFADNFVQLLGREEAVGCSVNLVNPDSVTWDMIYHEIGRQLNKEVKIVHIASDTLALSRRYDNASAILGDKQYSNIYSTENLKKLMPHFSCRYTLEKGTELFLEYMNDHEELKKEDPEFDQWCDEVIADYETFMADFRKKH